MFNETEKPKTDPETVFTVTSKRTPKPKVDTAVMTRPISFTFTDGSVVGAIKFIKAGDIYMRDGRAEKYPTTKITIQVLGQDKPFNLSREVYYALMDSLADPMCSAKIAEWKE